VPETSDPVPSRADADDWLTKAEEDLLVAVTLQRHASSVGWAACYHGQQAAEKALKAVLVSIGVDFPRSHALERLAALLPSGLRSRFDENALVALTPWAVAGRYPKEVENPNGSTIEAVLALARDVVTAARQVVDPLD
jgi:HEPN domain-containing protein